MAQYVFNPNDFAVDDNPVGNGWTYREGGLSASSLIVEDLGSPIGDKGWLLRTEAGNDYVRVLLDDIPQITTDMQVLSLWKGSPFNGVGNLLRLNDSGAVNSYFLGARTNNTSQVRFRKVLDGTRSDIANASHGDARNNTDYYWIKSEIIGSAGKVKLWKYGEAEPGWQIEQTDTSLSSGGAGICDFLYSSNNSFLLWFAVGTDGDPAPTEPVSVGITLSPASMRSASRLASPVITQAHTIQPDDARSVSRLDVVQINQAHVISPSDVRSESVLDASELTKANNLDPDDARSASRLAASLLTQGHIISPADLASASELDASSLTQNGLLNPADSRSVSRLDASVLMQDHIISPADARSVSRLSVATLIAQGSISPDGLRCGTRLDSVVLVQANQLAPADLLSASRLDPAEITQANVLQPDGLRSASLLESSAVSAGLTISPDSLWSGSRLDGGVITQSNVLTVNDLVSASRLDAANIFLTDGDLLGPIMTIHERSVEFYLQARGTTFYLSGRN